MADQTELPFKDASVSSAFKLVAAGNYQAAAIALKESVEASAITPQVFRGYVDAMLLDDELEVLSEYVVATKHKWIEDPSISCFCAAVLKANGQTDESNLFKDIFISAGGKEADFLKVLISVYRLSGNVDAQLDSLLEMSQCVGVDPQKALLVYTNVCLQFHAIERVEAIIDRIDQQTYFGRQIAALVDVIQDDLDALFQRLEAWLVDPNSHPSTASVIEMLWLQVGGAQLLDIYRRSLVKWSGSSANLGRAMFYNFGPSRTETAEKPSERINAALDQANHLDIAEALIERGDFDQAISLIEQTDSLATKLNKQKRQAYLKIASILKDTHFQRLIIKDDMESDWQLSDPGAPGKLCIVFTGLNGRPTVGIQTLDRFLASLGYQALYVRDFQRLSYELGVVSRGPKKEDTEAALRDVISNADAEHPIFFGASLGAIGAINFGLALKAKSIVTFGGSDRSKHSSRWRLGDARTPLLKARDFLHFEGDIPSTAQRISNAEHSFNLKMYFETQNQIDAYYARTFAGLSGVSLIGLEGAWTHDCLRSVLIRDLLRDALED